MPPKTKITKENILAAALEIVRRHGAGALNARAIAKRLNCSTQPIFTNYASMKELMRDVIEAANRRYQRSIDESLQSQEYPPYKASGMAYIRFAKEEKELFRLLFMRDRTNEEIREEREALAPILKIISQNTGLSADDSYLFHMEMWIYVHGIATMAATSYLDWDWELISAMMTDAYQGLKLRFVTKEEKTDGCNCDKTPDQTV